MSEIPSENILLAAAFFGFLVCFMFVVCSKAKPSSSDNADEIITEDKTTKKEEPIAENEPSAAKAVSADSGKIDDLKTVEGIGPKIESLLHAGGITSMVSLANSETAAVRKILDEAGPRFRMHNPETWSNQAKLIADEKWDELKEYQLALKGGKTT